MNNMNVSILKIEFRNPPTFPFRSGEEREVIRDERIGGRKQKEVRSGQDIISINTIITII